MAQLNDILAPVATAFEAFETMLRQTTLSETSLLKPITRDILKSQGKRMRPLLTLLTGALHNGANERVISAAVLVEMIHWATLIHDDVIDEAYVRRGEWTPGRLLRSKKAVLIGDYLFSKGLDKASRAGSFRAIRSSTEAIQLIVEGELMQMEHSRKMDVTEEIYTDIVRHKTASLLSTAAESGVLSSYDEHDDSEKVLTCARRMRLFGELIGIAFQIKDDLLDYGFTAGGEPATGKVLCNDIKERKMTLPLIVAFRDAGAASRMQARFHMRRAPSSAKSVEWICRFVKEHDGIGYSVRKMEEYHHRALEILEPYPDSPVKEALKAYADYVIGRKY